jgi:hypothetical protein
MLSYYVTAQVYHCGRFQITGRPVDREETIRNIEDVRAIEHEIAVSLGISDHLVTLLNWKRFESPQH